MTFYIVYAISPGIAESTANPWKYALGRYVLCFSICCVLFWFVFLFMPAVMLDPGIINYKILFTIPVSKSKIFFSKALFIRITVLFSTLLSYILFLGSGYLLAGIFPDLGYQNYDYREVIFYEMS
ncbi:hypothetical protein DRF60_10930 [Chryseobacterium elymi]|uniref:Uncharacterized protein n=1 Tax=Chryseobacterium elymi TaxID=395936 RepID=A0A3D9DHU6_9FLAO|nr:hypothetical protein [Chryseobacterium elymi]REC77496.1 hypothetical protein DRF60_10930 [Chryseobacterium elymi]